MRILYLTILLLQVCFFASGQKPALVILGVDHSSQLINYQQQPAALRAFISKMHPAAVCIERSPEEFSRNDFYEFTYEQQYVIVPFAKEKQLPLYPIDWLPPVSDMELAFGKGNLEVPDFIRQPNGFLGFTTFTTPADMDRGLYFADEDTYAPGVEKWYAPYPEKINFDFPRRLFLYRTFQQAKRIERVLQGHTERDTILVVIGAYHKHDISTHLGQNGYRIIRPDTFGEISEDDIQQHFREEDAYAILSFNLLGMQSRLGKINTVLIDKAFAKLGTVQTPELDLFRAKYAAISQTMNDKELIKHYRGLLGKTDPATVFTWNGVKVKTRVDSYFDPFGNLTVQQRIQLELAAAHRKAGQEALYKKEMDDLLGKLSIMKQHMLLAYADKYLKSQQ